MAGEIIQMTYSDLERLFKKIAGNNRPERPVSRKKAMEITGMTDWEIRKAVEANPAIRKGNNLYDVQLLKTA